MPANHKINIFWNKKFAVFLMSVWDKTVTKFDCMKSKSIFSDSQWRLLGPGGSGFRHITGVRSSQKRRANVVWSDAGPKRPSRQLGCVTERRKLEAERKGCYEPDQHSKRRTPESCRSVHSFERTGKIHFPICLRLNWSYTIMTQSLHCPEVLLLRTNDDCSLW